MMLFLLFCAIVVSSHRFTSSPRHPHRHKHFRRKPSKLFIGNGNNYNFDLWGDPKITYNKRNKIGRAIYQAKKLIKLGKSYSLGYEYSNDLLVAPFVAGSFWNQSIFCRQFARPITGSCSTKVESDSIDNHGTQWDAASHTYLLNDNGRIVYHNNFFGDEITEFGGLKYIGAEQYPNIFTRAFLLDIADYLKVTVTPDSYVISEEDILGTMNKQNIRVTDLTYGDIVLIYSGWARAKWETGDFNFFNIFINPALNVSMFKNIFFHRGVMGIGIDGPTPDNRLTSYTSHPFWLTCSGGQFFEILNLSKWIDDTRNGKAPYIGAFIYNPVMIKGATASIGHPVVYV